jgi:hypothetical protein
MSDIELISLFENSVESVKDNLDSVISATVELSQSRPYLLYSLDSKIEEIRTLLRSIDLIPKSDKEQLITRLAPLFINCQQQNVQSIREGVRGCGPQRVVSVTKQIVVLNCGHTIPLMWLPTWERLACISLFSRLTKSKTVL